MIVALGVLLVTSLLVAAAFTAVQSDVPLAAHDLTGKQAYYAARAGMNTYLYNLNQNPTTYWTNCSNDYQTTPQPVPGSTTGQQYSYKPILANGSTSCTTNPITSLIDTPTGTLTMEFEGYAGNPVVTKGIVVSFRMESPLDYLWYTKYEALDPGINGYQNCNVFYRTGRPSYCNIQWVTGDVVNGPMYTQDQYLVPSGQTPTFGGSATDPIKSAAPGTTPGSICANNTCNSANIVGDPLPNQSLLPLPQDNSALATDAATYGISVSGTTTVTLNANGTATVVSCTTSSSSSCSYPSGTVNGVVNPAQDPIIYANNASCYTATSYTPFGATYQQITNGTYGGDYYGCAGDVYVSGSYTSSLTIAAANDVIIDGNITTTPGGTAMPTNGAVLGLVANGYVRVQHGVSGRSGNTNGACGGGYGGGASNIASQTQSNLVIDAAILNIQNSFIVDNYDCGASLGNLTVNGSIVQYYRGAVGTTGGTGYLKNYSYDERLQNLLPPFLFNISGAPWDVVRETLCVPGGSVASTACQ